MGMGWPAAGGGGSTGNLSGDLTNHFVPVASGLHTLVNGIIEQVGSDTIARVHGAINTQVDGDNPAVIKAAQAGSGNTVQLLTSRGSLASPSVLLDGDEVIGLFGYGYNGTNFYNAGYFQLKVDGSPSAGNCPGRWELWTLDADGDSFLGLAQNPDGTLESTRGFTALETLEAVGDSTLGVVEVNGVATFNEKIEIDKTTQNRYQALSIVTAEIDVDASLSNWYDVVVVTDAEFQTPSNPDSGRIMQFRIRKGGAGAVTFDAGYRFLATPDLTSADGTYYLFFEYHDLDAVWDCVGDPRGPFGAS